MVSRLRWFAVIAACAVAFWTAGASAQDVPVDATQAMQEGARLYQLQDYAAAAVEFRRAYEIAPYAIFLFNAARASQQGDNDRQAYLYYEQALAERAEDRRLDPMLSARANAAIHAIDASADAKALALTLWHQSPVVADVRWTQRGWIGAGTAATGSALLVTSLVFARSASNQISDLSGVSSESAYNLQAARIERTQNIGRGFLYSGGLLVAVGAGLAIWDLGTVERKEFPRVSIMPSSDGFGAVVGGSF